MTFIETFSAVFMATLFSQISIWLIERYIKKHWNTAADKIETKIKTQFNGGKL